MLSVTKIVEFEAAHCLPNHKGKCKNHHGHSYKAEIEVGNKNNQLNEEGMIIDFGDLKEIINRIVDEQLDHTYLNDFFTVPPTAEHMVMWIVEEFEKRNLTNTCQLLRVRLWETSNSYAEWRAN